MSHIRALYHIVISTKHRQMTMPLDEIRHLYQFIHKLLKSRNCYLYRIGGISNHVHMLIDLHPSVALAELMKALKSQSSGFLKTLPAFAYFNGWSNGYYAASVSYKNRHDVIEYIKDQINPHHGQEFATEIERLVKSQGMSMCPEDYF